MTKENKDEKSHTLSNVIIAKMVGIEPMRCFSEQSKKDYYYYYNNIETKDCDSLPSYHCDWDCLMSVVEFINKRDWVTIYADECKIHALDIDEFETISVVKEGRPLIEAVYGAVLKYAEWYLENAK